MNTVQPIRNKTDIAKMKKALGRDRDRLLFIFGINSALRISDILKLRVSDVRGKDFIYLREGKTGKERKFPINQSIKTAVRQCVSKDAADNEYLFVSRIGNNKPISRVQAYRILNAAAERCGILEKVGELGTHSLRKTWAYHAYKAGVDLTQVQIALNHDSQADTLRYIGITQEQTFETFANINL